MIVIVPLVIVLWRGRSTPRIARHRGRRRRQDTRSKEGASPGHAVPPAATYGRRRPAAQDHRLRTGEPTAPARVIPPERCSAGSAWTACRGLWRFRGGWWVPSCPGREALNIS